MKLYGIIILKEDVFGNDYAWAEHSSKLFESKEQAELHKQGLMQEELDDLNADGDYFYIDSNKILSEHQNDLASQYDIVEFYLEK